MFDVPTRLVIEAERPEIGGEAVEVPESDPGQLMGIEVLPL